MYVVDNPVLQRELITNLRTTRAFALLLAYVALLGAVVYLAWPKPGQLVPGQTEAAQRLVNLFFAGQFLLVSMIAPSFAAGSIAGEKERKSYEMLLATPLAPGAIVLGKLLAALCHLGILMFCALPIVLLCLPLGGVSLYEVLAAYVAMLSLAALFGMISVWASSYFRRSASAQVVAYLMILPLALAGVVAWNQLEVVSGVRLLLAVTVVPIGCYALCTVMWQDACRRLLEPADLGSEGKEVVDIESEAREAIGLYIQRDDFPDRLFAPPKRTSLMDDDTNPIYDKEMRSEIFAQGTLMLRLVIQISMGLVLVVMAYCLFFRPQYVAWYISYVLLFNMLVGPVFTAGSVTSERERQTLDLLLTTLVTPGQMLWGKLFSGLRISGTLTGFLLWPEVLACFIMPVFWPNLPTMIGYLLIVVLCCATTSITALCCSTVFQRSTTSLICTYLIIGAMFLAPQAAGFFAGTFYESTAAAGQIDKLGVLSPFSAAFALPLEIAQTRNGQSGSFSNPGNLGIFFGHLAWTVFYNAALLGLVVWLFRVRWRVSD